MRSFKTIIVMFALAVLTASICAAATVNVSPFGGDDPLPDGERKAGPGGAALGMGPGLQAAADYIVGEQCSVGGWCWEYGTGCCSDPLTVPYNTVAPIILGLLNAYAITGDPSHLAAAELGASWDMSSVYTNGESLFSAGTAMGLYELAGVTGNTAYSDYVAEEFYDKLTAGTYGPDDLDTYGYIAQVQTGRSGILINLRSWEFTHQPYVASNIGNTDSAPGDGYAQQQAFIDAILDGLNTLDSTTSTYWDYIGLAGAVEGLAKIGITSFTPINAPNSPMVNGVSTLCGLANALVAEQNADGSWDYHSNLPADPSNADTQITAYAVMALIEAGTAGCGPYPSEIAKARDWLRSMQFPNGSFEVFPGGGYANTEVDGEALDALELDPCTDNKLTLEVPTASACVQPGDQVTVELWQRNLLQAVRGFQAWMQFDSTQMTFNNGVYTTTPYGQPVLAITATGDDIDSAAGLAVGQSPTSADALLATLTFDTLGMPDGPTVVSFRDRQPPTRFTDEFGQEVLPCLVPSPTILIDGTAPVISCPLDTTVQCHESTDPADTGMATAVDNLDDSPVVTWADVNNLGGCNGTGFITRTWTATDCAGNTGTCVQTVTVVDTTDPEITCPDPITIECEVDPIPANTGTATATDNCDLDVFIDFTDVVTPGACPQEETIVRTWVAEDDCGNTDTCDQVITVVDDTPPAITCPPDVTIECDVDTSPSTQGEASAIDNCDGAPVITFADAVAPGSCPQTYVITRTWMAEDACGNVSTCPQTITVQDTVPPAIVQMPDITVNADPGGCEAVVTWPDPVVTDNCSAGPSSFFDGFEADPYITGDPHWNDSDSLVTRVPSGTGGITSKSGAAHGVLDSTLVTTYTGAYSRLGGYSSEFGNGFTASVEVYMDLSDPRVGYETYGWDLAAAASRQNGEHLRDFIFHTADTTSGTILVAGDNNTNFARRGDLALLDNNYEIITSGWYTFEWDFHENVMDGSLEVDLNLYDGTGTHLWTETRNEPTDLIATVVGGNRYMWFTFLDVDTLAIDNTTMNASGGISVVVDPPSGSIFPAPGPTQVTITATDECGYWVESFFDVYVEVETEMVVDLSLAGIVTSPLSRCITFELWDCGVGGPPTIVEQEIEFIGGVATGVTVMVPCDNYTCVTARDKLHTLRRTLTPLTVAGTQYVANFASPLTGGNLNDDEWIDILDFGVFNWQYGTADLFTDCNTLYPHADIDGDGLVDSDDFSFISNNFLDTHDPNCCGAPAPLGSGPVLSISVQELIARGMGELAAGDLNNDGWLNQSDVVAFMQGARPDQFGIGGVKKPISYNKR